MKGLVFVAFLAVTLGVAVASPDGEENIVKRSVLAGLTIAGSVLQGLGELIKGFNGTDEVKDTIIYGRAIRVFIPKDSNCAVITDRESGYKSQKCAADATTAASVATEELFGLLIKLRFVDGDSLHHKPIPATRPPAACLDKLHGRSCESRVKMGHCDPSSPYFHYMHDKCYRTCAGCQSIDAIKAAFQNQADVLAGKVPNQGPHADQGQGQAQQPAAGEVDPMGR